MHFIRPNFYGNAIEALLPAGTSFALFGPMEWNEEIDADGNVKQTTPKNIDLFGKNITLPTKEQIDAKAAELEAEWESKEYQRLRAPAYPPVEMLADAIYWQQQGDSSKMEEYLAAVQAVKDQFPKE